MTRKQSPDFRSAEVAYVMQCWQAGESCSLVGIGSIGKSNLIHHLADSEIQARHLKELDLARFRAIVIDPNMLGALPSDANSDQVRAWAGYELMMHRLFLAYYPFEMLGAEDARRFYETYQALQDGTNPLYASMGLRYFELGLQFFMRNNAQIVFMFDEFEELLRQMPVRFFQSLRGLRDANKNRLSYLALTRSTLPVLIEKYKIPPQDIEPFVELFTDNVYYVGPYSDADARAMLEDLSTRQKLRYPPALSDYLFMASGRYAGLLRAAFHSAESINRPTLPALDDQLTAQLAAKPAVRTECRTIWTSLTDAERYVLKAVARLKSYQVNVETEQAVTSLVQKRLLSVNRGEQRLEIQPPLFRVFVERNLDQE